MRIRIEGKDRWGVAVVTTGGEGSSCGGAGRGGKESQAVRHLNFLRPIASP